MRYAILDMGTNVFSLLLTEITKEGYQTVGIVKFPSLIGKDGINSGTLNSRALASTDESMMKTLDTIEKLGGADYKYAIATSAVRGASNSEEFRAIVESYGFQLSIIEGRREAELIYKGVRESMIFYDETFAIMDIGGGSNEFIIANRERILWKESYNMGVVRVRDYKAHSEPITVQELEDIKEYYNSGMSSFWEAVKRYNPTILIGCSGSFDTLREIIYPDDNMEVPSKIIDREELRALHHKLISSNRIERAAIRGMSPIRVDYIVIGSILVDLVISRLNPQEIHQSSFSLKEGCMAEIYESLLKGD